MLQDRKFNQFLESIHNDGQEMLNLKGNYSEEMERKIIEIYDLKTTGMIDFNFRQKFVKNRQFIE
jgi:hypothetical protein